MIQTIKLQVRSFQGGGYTYSHLTSSSNPNPVTSTVEETEFLKISDYEKFRDFIKNIGLRRLQEGEKVYFDPKVAFPRKKFRETYEKNPIVMNPVKADVIIVDKFALLSEFNHKYSNTYTKLIDGTWTYEHNLHYYSSSTQAVRSNPVEDMDVMYYNGTSMVDRINYFYSMAGKFVDISDINLSSDEVLNTQAYERITKMFEGGTDDMKNLAMRLLTAYNYDTEKHKIALLLHFHWEEWRKMGNKKVNVEIKAMLRKLAIDYPGYDNYYGNHLAFWSRISLEMPNDEVVQNAFNNWFHEQIKDPKFKGKRIKIILEDEQSKPDVEQPTP